MEIKYHGHACFYIKDKDFVLVTDPYDDSGGLKLPSLKATVVTSGYNDPQHNNTSAVEGDPKVFNWPGEYETSSVHFKGVTSFHNSKEDEEQKENTIFTIELNGIGLCHLGALGTKLTPEQLEDIGDVDILFIPVGGKGCIDAKKAKEVIEQIEPRIIIPMAYHVEGSTVGSDPLESFLSEMGAQGVEPVDEFVLRRSELPDDASKVVVINPS